MTDQDRVDTARAELKAAGEVFAARREIDSAIADLAASPLDEAAADQMREVLAGDKLRRARQALTGLVTPPPLRLVEPAEGDPS